MIKKNYILIVLLGFLITNCVEEVNLVTETEFESALVVEASITNQIKTQTIKLSRTYKLEEDGPSKESGAEIKIIASNGNTYAFQEDTAGIYNSVQQFAAQQNVEYHLEITTANGRNYKSTTAVFTSLTQIDNLYLERNFNENGDEGVSIYIDTYDPLGNVQFYRYEYEETYKIVAPKYSPFELIINNDDFPYPPASETFAGMTPSEIIEFFVIRDFREEQEEICFNTVNSTEIQLVDAEDFTDNVVERYRVRFISRENYILSHRYSILVKQYVQSNEAYSYYQALNALSTNENILSETQPGFLQGNLYSTMSPSEKVIGFFEVASVDEQRIYFNYADLFPEEDLPPYYIPCNAIYTPGLYVADMATGIIGYSPIQIDLSEGLQYYDENLENGQIIFGAPYMLVLPECGDCTFLGENEPPDFWVD